MAIPTVFTYIKFKNGVACDRYIEPLRTHIRFRLIDGGVTDNMPTKYYTPLQRPSAVAFALVSSDTDPNPVYDSNPATFKCDWFYSWLIKQIVGDSSFNVCDYQKQERVNAQHFANNGGDIVSLNSTGIDMLSFDFIAKPETQKKYEGIAKQALLQHMKLRKDKFNSASYLD